MQEVAIRLRFTTPCLGRKEAKRGNQLVYRLPRDAEDRVVFLAAWWRDRMQFAAQVRARGQSLVSKIVWSPVVDGQVKYYRRAVTNQKRKKRIGYAVHESFDAGDTIGICAVLPSGLTVDDCRELLTLVGRYRGMSWFQSDDVTYGMFEVESVNPTRRKDGSSDTPERSHD